ncbi:MAG: HAMP domain-containing histidine kinase [Planctomycetes bacterium]|nr:HAMP domain-containing histidine kinase [Planctomycetota bacterium]MCB9869125.1 HAMP domain-containing histidine kinase [Planctomycetota bacterium]
MSPTHKLTLFALLLVTGTGWLVLSLCSGRASRDTRSRFIASCEQQAAQLIDIFGTDLLADPDSRAPQQAEAGVRVREAFHRILGRGEGHAGITAAADHDGQAIIVQELRNHGAPRPQGTPLLLSHEGHRAMRTGTVQSQLVDGDSALRVFAPIRGEDQVSLGLLVLESNAELGLALGSTTLAGTAIALLAGLLGVSFLVVRYARPLERLQDQLIAKENLTAADVRTPSDLLREVTKAIDKAHTDRNHFRARLTQQEQEAESRVRMKDEMIANTVHELRTPLTSIIASLEIVMDHRACMSAEEQSEFLSQASIAGKHMMFVVNDLLDSAAIEAGKISMEIECCNLQKLLLDAKRSMDMVAAAKGMELVVPPINPQLHVTADYARSMQVIFNLVSNAVKYSPEGSRITLRAWANTDAVVFEIEDQGEGIPAAMRARLFTKFSKLSQATGPQVQSSGIGLYLSKKLVELMHGTIGYRESENHGSIFWFTLPLGPVREPAQVAKF